MGRAKVDIYIYGKNDLKTNVNEISINKDYEFYSKKDYERDITCIINKDDGPLPPPKNVRDKIGIASQMNDGTLLIDVNASKTTGEKIERSIGRKDHKLSKDMEVSSNNVNNLSGEGEWQCRGLSDISNIAIGASPEHDVFGRHAH